MLRILVVEDESSQRNGLIELLCAAGHLARGAATAREAMMLLRKGPVDVVLLDLVLEDTCGVQLLEALRQISASVHIIVTSGIAMVEPQLEGEWLDHEKELRAAGADDFVPKPIDMGQLEDALSRLSSRWGFRPLAFARPRAASKSKVR
jgi:CheY-like chemotaxis protein